MLPVVLVVVLLGCASKEASQKDPFETSSSRQTGTKPNVEKNESVSSFETKVQEASKPIDPPAPSDEDKVSTLAVEKIVAVSLLSPRSLSLKLQLKNGIKAVFKPVRKDDARARYEVAAYRIAKLVRVKEVPAAVMREISADFLKGRLGLDNADTALAFQEALPRTANGAARGAMIEWMEDIDPQGLEHKGGIAAVEKLLAPGRPDNGEEPLAAQASAMVVFDQLIGNWDRFSGGNFFVSKDGLRLILIDHNGSFAPWPDKRRERMEKRLSATERFSSSLIDRIRSLSAQSVRAAVSGTPPLDALLTEDEISLLLSRRDALLHHVDALVHKNGIQNTLVFP